MLLKLINADYRLCLQGKAECVFADPPDNIGLGYDEYKDKLAVAEYRLWLRQMVNDFTQTAPIVWLSFNARWTGAMGLIVQEFLDAFDWWRLRPCVQVFTFGQHSHSWLGNNHRPLWCLHHKDAQFNPEAIRVPSWRQRNGDKRANPKGRVPGDVFDMQYPTPGDAFDFPRVTGNSKHRSDWHPTQLHPELVERCILFSTYPGDTVVDPFAGTGTTLKVCEKLARDCITCEISADYAKRIAEENKLAPIAPLIYAREF